MFWLPGLTLPGGLGVLAGGIGTAFLALGWGDWGTEAAYILLALTYWLGSAALWSLPRLAFRWGREAWWISVGLSFWIAPITALPFCLLVLNNDDKMLRSGFWALGIVLIIGLILAVIRRRQSESASHGTTGI